MKRLSPAIEERLGLTLTTKTYLESAFLGLVFYETPISGVFLTNCNVTVPNSVDYDPDLSKYHQWLLYCPEQNRYIVLFERDLQNEETDLLWLIRQINQPLFEETNKAVLTARHLISKAQSITPFFVLDTIVQLFS